MSSGKTIRLTRNAEGVFIIEMNDGIDNRINKLMITELHEALDEVEANEGPTALVMRGAQPKFFSNGFNIDWLTNPSTQGEALASLHRLLARLLSLSVPSICCVNGHAFAGGAMLALAFDYRIMNAERGFLCTNELDIGFPYTDGMTALFSVKVPVAAKAPLLLGAERLTAARCLELGLIDAAVPSRDLAKVALARAKKEAPKGVRKALMRATKEQLYGSALFVLRSLSSSQTALRISPAPPPAPPTSQAQRAKL